MREKKETSKCIRDTSCLRRILMLCPVCLIMICVGLICLAVSTPAEERHSEKGAIYYTSICIQDGDTLWEIAERYADDTGMSIPEYVAQLREMNHIEGDNIQSGNYLMVSYHTKR